MSRVKDKYTHVDVEVFVTSTDKANLCKVADGREVWIPISLCHEIHKETHQRPLVGEGTGWVLVETWFATKEDLI